MSALMYTSSMKTIPEIDFHIFEHTTHITVYAAFAV